MTNEQKLKEIEEVIVKWHMGLHSNEAVSKIEKFIYPQLANTNYDKLADEAAKQIP